jgi:hypothetical protein
MKLRYTVAQYSLTFATWTLLMCVEPRAATAASEPFPDRRMVSTARPANAPGIVAVIRANVRDRSASRTRFPELASQHV